MPEEYQIKIFKTGLDSQFWTYEVYLNEVLIKSKPLTYRLYEKKITAVNNAVEVVKRVSLNND